jgi:hypothetical protein
LTFTDTAEQGRDGDSGHSRLATIARQGIRAERLHPKTAYSRCRPTAEIAPDDRTSTKQSLMPGLVRRGADNILEDGPELPVDALGKALGGGILERRHVGDVGSSTARDQATPSLNNRSLRPSGKAIAISAFRWPVGHCRISIN